MNPTTARILTWNVWGRSGDWPSRRTILDTAIRDANADIIALQETWRDGPADQAAQLADHLGHHYVVDNPDGYDDRGLALLSRWPLTLDAVVRLPDGGAPSENRTALAATIQTPTGAVPVYVTHLNWRLDHGAIRRHQIAAIVTHLEQRPTGPLPAVLCGDLNTTPDADEIRALTGQATLYAPGIVFQDAWTCSGNTGPGHTWDHANPYAAPDRYGNVRLDYVLTQWQPHRRGRILSADLLTGDRAGTPASDHYGVLADIDLTVP